MRLLQLSIGLLFVAQGALACPFEIDATPRSGVVAYEMRWDEVPGTIRYSVYERRGDESGYRLLKVIEVDGELPRFVAHASSTAQNQYYYLVIAEGANGSACIATRTVEMRGDPQIASATHKRVVLLAGSVRGANGSDFRTALTMRTIPGTKGRIFFRPVGTTPSAADPFMRYDFPVTEPARDLYFEDIMATLGATGIGSLEIIPDTRPEWDVVPVPETHAHIYNVTPEGTFGSRVPAVVPSTWMREGLPRAKAVSVAPMPGNYRLNAGFRTITEVTYFMTVSEPGLANRHTEQRKIPANYTVFGSLESLFGGPISPNATVTIRFIAGHAIGFYTYTENSTNDPTLVVRDPAETSDVAWGF